MNAPLPEIAPPVLPLKSREKLKLEPSFLRAWRGIWLLTWKNQFTWQKLPMLLISLLVLPVLIYVTTSSPEKWAQRRTMFSDPLGQANSFAARLIKPKIQLTPEQRLQIQQIFTD